MLLFVTYNIKSFIWNKIGAKYCFNITNPVSIGPKNAVFGPQNLTKNLTPSLRKARMRLETLSAGSATTDTEGVHSPLWESEEVSFNEIIHLISSSKSECFLC